MKKTRYTEQQIACALKQAETGTPVAEVIRGMIGTAPHTGRPRGRKDARADRLRSAGGAAAIWYDKGKQKMAILGLDGQAADGD